MPKITFIGAGSTVFARNLLSDIFSFPELADSTISLFDIDAARLQTSEIVANTVARAAEARPTIQATTDRRRALDGSDYAICMVQVGGYKPSTVVDFDVPKKLRAHLPRRYARPAHRRRAEPRPDLVAGRRSDRHARRLAADLLIGAYYNLR